MLGASDRASCEICGAAVWVPVYQGPVRDGGFGRLTAGECTVLACPGCGVHRLEEGACKDDRFYQGTLYRDLLGESADTEGFWAAHDVLQIRHLNVLWPHSVRNRLVADVGCAAGSFLDHVSGLAAECLAIEPCREYHPSLADRGYVVFDNLSDAAAGYAGRVDFVFSFSTVEHVLNPLEFFRGVRDLLAPRGYFLVSTPNRADVLTDLLGDEYKRFFYRTVHRWYFDMESLSSLGERAGLEIVNRRCLHRFGISNALHWLRDRKPTGEMPLNVLNDPVLNEFWKSFLESKGAGDYLFLLARRKG